MSMEQIEIMESRADFQEEFVTVFGETYFSAADDAKKHFADHVGQDTLFVLFVNGKMSGFFSFARDYSHHANYLENICIIEKYRGEGFSHFMLRAYTDISRQQKTKNTIALSSTHVNNKLSQKMHESFGFKKIGVLKGLHYGVDEIFYSFVL